jgi:arsenate reductase (thioredoxin)
MDREPGHCRPDAPALDFVLTLCDGAGGETCPEWPGTPVTAHWPVPDPAETSGSPTEIALAFKDAYLMLHRRIGAFTALSLRSLDQLSLQARLNEIGDVAGNPARADEPKSCHRCRAIRIFSTHAFHYPVPRRIRH